MDKAALDNRSNQLNPNNPAYQGSGGPPGYTTQQCYLDNRANQMNPSHVQYWKSRGLDGPPSEGSGSSPSSWGSFCNLL